MPSEFQPLHERFEALFRKAGRDRSAGKASVYGEAAQVADFLLRTPDSLRPLHGDLHHENIMQGSRGWLAIDPKGVLGDPAFDAANLFYNPLGKDALCCDPERIRYMSELFARALDQPRRRILDHAFAYGCLSAAWHAEDGNRVEEERELSIATTIRAVSGQA